MPAERRVRPPRLATLLVRWRLPAELGEAVAGDLHEEYALRVAPARGPWVADLWYWGQALTLRAGALRRVSRRLTAMRPTWERNRPRRVGSHQPDFIFTPGAPFLAARPSPIPCFTLCGPRFIDLDH